MDDTVNKMPQVPSGSQSKDPPSCPIVSAVPHQAQLGESSFRRVPLCQTSCRLSSFSSGFSAEAINNETNSVFP